MAQNHFDIQNIHLYGFLKYLHNISLEENLKIVNQSNAAMEFHWSYCVYKNALDPGTMRSHYTHLSTQHVYGILYTENAYDCMKRVQQTSTPGVDDGVSLS